MPSKTQMFQLLRFLDDGGMECVLYRTEDPVDDAHLADLTATIADYESAVDDLVTEYHRLEAITLTLIADARLAIHDLRHGTLRETLASLESAIVVAETGYHALTMSPGEDVPVEEESCP